MKKIIHHLRSQPEEVRRHILHVSTIVAGIILVLLWIYSLGTSLSDPDKQAKTNNDLKPFSALKANLIGGYQSISDPE
ncbi:hypothetical protein A2738_03220 [Candidatus Nomurabacteria bacterium RIFCSPHIGHO2_01_FULL_42_15]|uniref:Uncharacterized protein n=1 Tax=Candidatus Nomurabacteria bacterium RIFCSPHIGHO2_01_FULL_42_15 TaxID=1801742 RepID=A0A1F6VE60_9BACT|nr:MAG: hypothetical protein A2738_03220 [Candidatus Nomurabacteria bacterium RIFCSPHIGHO2_01_FULL_42_15]OGI92933.1 MAG: hypothetical protein A3A99_00095 [Candidatus Nomurabacteria bacterium RIFCSPLOWO2_01_FULL_41_18]